MKRWIERDRQVVGDEVGGVGAVGANSADQAGGQKNRVRPVLVQPVLGRALIGQVEAFAVGMRISQPSDASRRTIAEPTMPLWPASCGSHMRLRSVIPAAANQQRVNFACKCGCSYEQTDSIIVERAL
jgi:hypothetical protein